MSTRVMTKEDIMLYAQRVVLFADKKRRNRKIFYVFKDHLVQEAVLFLDNKKQITRFNAVKIEDIYDRIELVYSRKTKGVLIARRSGNLESNKKNLMPLRRTGNGLSELIIKKEKNTPLQVYEWISTTNTI